MTATSLRPARVAAACLCIGLGSTLVESADPISLVPHWSKGDRIQLDVSKTRLRKQPGEAVVRIDATGSAEVAVLETGAEGHVVRWTYGETRLAGESVQGNPLIARLENLAKGQPMDLVLDAGVSITRVRNFEEIQASMAQMFDALRDEIVKQGAPAEMADGILGQLRPIFASEEAIRTHVVKLAPLYFLPLGRSLAPGETVHYDDVLASPFGGDPLPCKGEVRLESVDAGIAKVTWKQEVDRESALTFFRDMAKRMAEAGAPELPDDAVTSFEMSDRGEFLVDLRSGWVDSMTQVRTIRAGPDSEQVETTRITRRKPADPARTSDRPRPEGVKRKRP